MSILDENITQNMGFNGGLKVTGNMKQSWMTSSKWAMFFAILGFINIGFSVLMLGSMGGMLEMMMAMGGGDNPAFGMMQMIMPYLTIISLLVSAVMFFIHFFHLRFSNLIQRAVNFTDQDAFEKAWMNLRNHFRLFGITLCVMIGFYIIMIGVFATMAASGSIPFE